jgi:hypothetical protein
VLSILTKDPSTRFLSLRINSTKAFLGFASKKPSLIELKKPLVSLEKSGFRLKQQSRGFYQGPTALYLLCLFLKDTQSGRPPEYYYQYPYDVNYQVIAAGFFFKKHNFIPVILVLLFSK